MYFPDDPFALSKFRTKLARAASARAGVAESATLHTQVPSECYGRHRD